MGDQKEQPLRWQYFAKRNHKVSIITSKVSSETPFYKLVSGIETIGLEVLQNKHIRFSESFY